MIRLTLIISGIIAISKRGICNFLSIPQLVLHRIKTAGVWCIGIDFGAIGSNILSVFTNSIISIPSTNNGKAVVGVDFTQAHSTTFYNAVSLVKMVEVPKSVQYITSDLLKGLHL